MFQKCEDLLSVIVPAYNAEKYIQTTIDCLLHQTYPHLEIIVVDDGSTDGTADICDEYSARISSVRVIHQKNSGTYAARNTGLEAANGKYIAFIDADDAVDEYAYEILIDALINTKSDVSACDFTVEYSDHFEIRKSRPTAIDSFLYESEKNVRGGGVGASTHDLAGFVWNKVFTRACIGDIRFRADAPICDDMIFVYDVLARVNCAVHINIPMYHYRYVANSLSKGKKDISKFLGAVAAMDRLYRSCADETPQCLDSIAKTYLFWNTKTCEQILKAPNDQAFREIQENVKAYRAYIPKCSVRIRILCQAILISWHAYRPLGLIIWYMKQFYISIHRRK